MAQFYKVACGFLLLSGALFAQVPPRFEVASIRPSADQVNAVNIGLRLTGSQVRITAMSLKDYIGLPIPSTSSSSIRCRKRRPRISGIDESGG